MSQTERVKHKRIFYLASDSKARKKLFEFFGVRFRVLPSRVREKTHSGRITPAVLVQANARQKAGAVAARVKSGVIVAADTIVTADGRMYGKPGDLRGAASMLKKLSGRPQWVYTGICVVDKDSGRCAVAYEKTKIYMDELTDKEIYGYFREVSPLDKAGSFDIQGKGAFFIRRIEGCFYNVVGLPLNKLYRMFKQLDIRIFAAGLILPACGALFAGCATEYNVATGQQENYYYSSDQEVQMGKSIARQIEREYTLTDDIGLQFRVKEIGKKISAVCDRKDIEYRFKVLDEKDVNAVSLPGGYVYIFKGLIDKVDNDDELAAVIAHEVGHIVARHSIKKMQAVMGYSLMRLLAIPLPQSGDVITAADLSFAELITGYGREDELLADQLGARYAQRAGYNPRGMIAFLEKLETHNRRQPLRAKNYLKTHPYTPDRIRVVKQELGEKIDFNDYINIEDKPHDK
ncbi:MAG TPA: Maf and M48 domain-containing protein [Candidatus Omnitrophota bacterium]|nr:Maf and M48 domain-containing protein [Candidatus Omnitrophota bacterium]